MWEGLAVRQRVPVSTSGKLYAREVRREFGPTRLGFFPSYSEEGAGAVVCPSQLFVVRAEAH